MKSFVCTFTRLQKTETIWSFFAPLSYQRCPLENIILKDCKIPWGGICQVIIFFEMNPCGLPEKFLLNATLLELMGVITSERLFVTKMPLSRRYYWKK